MTKSLTPEERDKLTEEELQKKREAAGLTYQHRQMKPTSKKEGNKSK